MADDVFAGPQSYSRPKYGGVITSQSTFHVGKVDPGVWGATFSDSVPLQSGVRLNPDVATGEQIFVGSDAGVTLGNAYELDGELFIDVDNLNKVFTCATATGSTFTFIAS